jgi:hypothetical protein
MADQPVAARSGRLGTTENAVKTQIWIAISVYVLVAIVKKTLNSKKNQFIKYFQGDHRSNQLNLFG